jgi:tetratricopeptide (TPR) repeat protein
MNFDEIINIWQNAERESLSQFAPNKSDNCLTFAQFEQYIQGQYTPDQNQHVQSCAYCQKMIRLFQKYAAETLPTTEKINWLSRLLANWRNNWQNITEGLNELVKPIPVPARLTIVGLAAAIILMLLLIPSDYGSAINKLLLVIKKQPEDMNANFYVGLCYLLTKKTDRAIFHLQRIIELNGEFLYEKCYWYLGNAYLMKEDGKKALEMFEKVVAMEGDFEWEAREMIVDIKEISNK